jgi:hypothetical protein
MGLHDRRSKRPELPAQTPAALIPPGTTDQAGLRDRLTAADLAGKGNAITRHLAGRRGLQGMDLAAMLLRLCSRSIDLRFISSDEEIETMLGAFSSEAEACRSRYLSRRKLPSSSRLSVIGFSGGHQIMEAEASTTRAPRHVTVALARRSRLRPRPAFG